MALPFKQQLFTKSDCYKAGRKIKVKGLMLHSTGANNPDLSRYIQPDDGLLGDNKYNNDWNRSGLNVCVHAFIGKDKNGNIQTYQTLPWEHRGWHAGGSANDTHIGVEICEDGLNDREYFEAVYDEAVKLFAHLAKHFGLKYWNIIDHSEGHAQGIASNHGDITHWFKRYSKTMKDFRLDVKALMEADNMEEKNEVVKNDDTLEESKVAKTPKKTEKTISQLADEVLRGVHGSGRERMLSLGNKYAAVQKEVNRRLRGK